jgi:hypothetical protein
MASHHSTLQVAVCVTLVGAWILASASLSTARAQQRCAVAPVGAVDLTDGSADQGFGKPAFYRTPVTNVSQGATQAGSDPKSAFRVEGLGLAVRAATAKNAASTLSNTKTTSSFTIKARSLCTVELFNSTSVIHLINAVAGFRGGVTVKNAAGRAVADLQRAYTIQPAANPNFVDILVGKATIRTVLNAGGNLIPSDPVPPQNIALAPGKYELIVEITVTTKAEQQADLIAAAEAALH